MYIGDRVMSIISGPVNVNFVDSLIRTNIYGQPSSFANSFQQKKKKPKMISATSTYSPHVPASKITNGFFPDSFPRAAAAAGRLEEEVPPMVALGESTLAVDRNLPPGMAACLPASEFDSVSDFVYFYRRRRRTSTSSQPMRVRNPWIDK